MPARQRAVGQHDLAPGGAPDDERAGDQREPPAGVEPIDHHQLEARGAPGAGRVALAIAAVVVGAAQVVAEVAADAVVAAASGPTAPAGWAPKRTSAPSWSPASVRSKSGSATWSPMSSALSGPLGSSARARSSTVADGLFTLTSSSRRLSPSM